MAALCVPSPYEEPQERLWSETGENAESDSIVGACKTMSYEENQSIFCSSVYAPSSSSRRSLAPFRQPSSQGFLGSQNGSWVNLI